jgi:superfamily II DNA or RNA helicase/uncharacterized protein YjeT (DUF2065 family)
MNARVEPHFLAELQNFAASGYRFDSDYTLYKLSQQEGVHGYLDGIAAGYKHGYIELPTGVGKTALFIALIQNFLKSQQRQGKNARVLIAVPTEKLAVQTAQAFAKFLPEIARTIETDGDEGQEIDWENSDIGLQYGKMKHADRKPRVLITTYQSLARDTGNKVYSPKEYGFVIYDEGHSITAPSFGRAVDKFTKSYQLAVTATPEYTDKRTVAARLPHCYYRLPLAEAINRGDLCNVRPAIIKTGYKLNEAKFHQFMTEQAGTPMNASQLQQLLNQEARNLAVVQTYLYGTDPDNGGRYFGQNGMVFSTGIRHAEAMVSLFNKEMSRGEGLKLKKWLDAENTELIAAVHGQAKGAWLRRSLTTKSNRQYRDHQEWYTEEEIFDLHEIGKILLLASVAKLKWGYDSPRDSLLFDLADRFSKVDATQIDGRAFRLDPDDPEKTATVFNLMDENTEELYALYPKLIPIYCSEVIEGAQVRPASRRHSAHVRFKQPPPGMLVSLEKFGFDVVTNIDTVRTISQNNQQRRNEAKKRGDPREEGWLSKTEINSFYTGTALHIRTSIAAWEDHALQQQISAGKSAADAAAYVAKNCIGIRLVGDKLALCVSPAGLEWMTTTGRLQLKSKMENRLEITEEMYADLVALVKRKGNFGGSRLADEIQAYEARKKLPDVGISKALIDGVIYKQQKTVEKDVWKRLHEGLNTLPDRAEAVRIEYTEPMHTELLAKVEKKGGIRGRNIVTAIEAYEARHGKDSTGISPSGMNDLLNKTCLTVDAAQWQRVIAALAELPDTQKAARVTITETMHADLVKKLARKGNLGPVRAYNAINAYEAKHKLESTGLSKAMVQFVSEGRTGSLVAAQWERLNAALDDMPDQNLAVRIEITDEMYEGLKATMEAKGRIGIPALLKAVKAFEAASKLPDSGIDKSLIDKLVYRGTKSMLSDQWDRVKAVLKSLPDAQKETRVDITPAMDKQLQKKLAAAGGIKAFKLASTIAAYEAAEGLETLNLKMPTLHLIITGTQKSIFPAQWTRIIAALDNLLAPAKGKSKKAPNEFFPK